MVPLRDLRQKLSPGGMLPDMGENTRYAVGTLYRDAVTGSQPSTRDHIGIVDHVVGSGIALVKTLCGRKGKIVPHEIRDAQGTNAWFDVVGRERLSDFLCLTCKRVWDRLGD